MPYVEELVRRLRTYHPPVEVEYTPRRTAYVRFTDPPVDHRITLWTSETELGRAVTTIGEGCRDALWPDDTVESAGFTPLLVHVDEVIATRDTISRCGSRRTACSGPDSAVGTAATVGDRS